MLNEAAAEAAFAQALEACEAGRLDTAARRCRAILARHPAHADSLHLLGLIATRCGDPRQGATLLRRAIALAPGRGLFHHSLALALRQLGRTGEAVAAFRRAVACCPGSAEMHNNLAATLRDADQGPEAIAQYRRAAELAPGVAEIWYNLATALADAGGAAEPIATAFRRALALRPDFAAAHANFGRWLLTTGRFEEAAAELAEAIRHDAGDAAAWNNRGIALQELGHTAAAEASYRRALQQDAAFADAHYNLGCLLLADGRTDAAAACQSAAIAADPGHGAARLALCMAQLPILYRTPEEIGERRRRYAAELDALIARAAAPDGARLLAAAIGRAQPFFLPYQGEDDRELQARYGQLACRVLAATAAPVRLPGRPAPGERIRIGIVSGFFCTHTVFRLFLEGWLTRIDRTRFAITGFHTGHGHDDQTVRAAAWCDRFVHLPPGAAWPDAIAATAPHVLLYPEIGMDPVATRLAAQRLAPVQCVAWGHPETTGMPTLDYFLSSALMEPADGDACYTEQLVRLPNLGLHCEPSERPPPLTRAALGLDAEEVVYWSGQALYKYLPQHDAIFPRIAAAVGACRFVFIAFARSEAVTAAFRERLGRAFAAAGLDAARHCLILPPLSPQDFIAAAGLADVVLDTPGWSGGKSTLDCLTQDPVIVTLPGRFLRARHTAAILRRIGCTATIARSVDDYVALAVRLGQDTAWRAAMRRAVAAGKAQAFRDMDYVRALEAFLERAVARSG